MNSTNGTDLTPLDPPEYLRVRKMIRPLMVDLGIPITVQTLTNWRQKQIPYKWHYDLLTRAQEKGIPLTKELLMRYGLNRR